MKKGMQNSPCWEILLSIVFVVVFLSFQKKFQENHQSLKQLRSMESELIGPDILSGLILVQNSLQRLSADTDDIGRFCLFV